MRLLTDVQDWIVFSFLYELLKTPSCLFYFEVHEVLFATCTTAPGLILLIALHKLINNSFNTRNVPGEYRAECVAIKQQHQL